MSSLEIGAPVDDGESNAHIRRRNAIRGGFLSVMIDMFDIYLPVIVLAPIQTYFLPTSVAGTNRELLESLVFVTTLVGRPIGAFVFGRVANSLGRRKASIVSVSGFGAVTLLIALLPGYATLGIASYALLVVLRFIDGVFLGGGYTGAIPLALENSAKHQRGLVGGLIMAGYPALVQISGLVEEADFDRMTY
ncbi:MFS transporter [Paraburkholderia xenovorans]